MKKKKVCLIAQFPAPIHGLSKAVETLYNSYLTDEFDFEKVDITSNKKFLKNIIKIWGSKADLFYLTISQTKGGNIRDLIIFKLLRLQKKKCLIHLHGGYYRKLVDNDMGSFQRNLNYKVIKQLDGVIVLSESLKSIFQGMIDDKKIFVIPNCVDDRFLMGDAEFEEKMAVLDKKEVLHVLYLSNFIKTKGYIEVLKMAKLEKERALGGDKKKIHFDFAGKFFEVAEREFFFNYIKQYGLEEFVTYHGIVDGQQKKELLKKCDIFTLLTRYPNEGQPISILESMGNGMVIVTTDHAGIPDIVKDGVNGIMVTTSQQQNIVELYSRLYCDKKTMINNRNTTLQYYVESTYLSNLQRIFNEI
ncbi:glycosyltransferase family 4 protein [Peribacillus frigoritolerans]|uniref:glycosyltransferase family 4 protein n=1 Tax=Peribacillus frigoritolerans TaxID=450367 RepID=UPI002B24D0BE|nr:glycosyltransferase family 4 protein [Peribacillus frigoritolerans]MEB2629675.1 glycosyltransferase family 4 protein [Peribacillus frigoritolerans]